jgi:hypothetical protein
MRRRRFSATGRTQPEAASAAACLARAPAVPVLPNRQKQPLLHPRSVWSETTWLPSWQQNVNKLLIKRFRIEIIPVTFSRLR